jgi:hypothetical protein
MTLLPVLVAVLLGILALSLVLYPLYRHAPLEVVQQRTSASIATTQAETEQAARAALKEVELDYQLGNLAELDYRTLRDRYTRRAFTAMKSRQQNETALDALIEERLRLLKEERETTPDENETVTEKHEDATEQDHDEH